MMLRFSDSGWIKKHNNIIITGPTGIGKSFIASAFGNTACMYGFKTLYFNCAKLFELLKLAKAQGIYMKEIKRIEKQELLILDDFGLHPIDEQSKLILLLEDRFAQNSTIITSQFPIKNWHETIANSTIADAICDRLIHNSYKIELKGDSMRKKYKKHSG